MGGGRESIDPEYRTYTYYLPSKNNVSSTKDILVDVQLMLQDSLPGQMQSFQTNIPLRLSNKNKIPGLIDEVIHLWGTIIEERRKRSLSVQKRDNATLIEKIANLLGQVIDKLTDQELEAVYKVVDYVSTHPRVQAAFLLTLQQAFEICVYEG